MPVTYPLVNGIRFDFSSIEFVLAGKRFAGIKSLNYKQSLTPGELRGTAAQIIGRTRGQYACDADLEIYREDADDFFNIIQARQPTLGLGEISFDLNVNFFEPNPGGTPSAQNDIISGCRLKEDSASQAQSADPVTIKLMLHPMLILRNGRAFISVPQAIGVLR